MLVLQINLQKSAPVQTPAQTTQTYLERDFFPQEVKKYCMSGAFTLYSLESHLLEIDPFSVDPKNRGNSSQYGPLFKQCQNSSLTLIHYLEAADNPLHISSDAIACDLFELSKNLDANKPTKTMPDLARYGASIASMRTLARMFGDSDLAQDASDASWAAMPNEQKFDVLLRCESLLKHIASDPMAYLAPGLKFSSYVPVEKPSNAPGSNQPFSYLHISIPTLDAAEAFVPLDYVLSPEFRDPHYKQINRVYVPQWVAEHMDIIVNGIRSLLHDLVTIGVTNGEEKPDELKKLCFRYGSDELVRNIVVSKNPDYVALEFDEVNLRKMALSIAKAARLDTPDVSAIMGDIQSAIKSAAKENAKKDKADQDLAITEMGKINLAKEQGIAMRSSDEGTLASYVMNQSVAVATMNLVNEYVLSPFLTALGGQSKNEFVWDANHREYLRRSVLSQIVYVNSSGSSAQIGEDINLKLKDRSSPEIDFSPAGGAANLQAIDDLLSKKAELAQISDKTGARLLLRLNTSGTIDVLKPYKFHSVGSGTQEAPLPAGADLAVYRAVDDLLLGLDTNSRFYGQSRKGTPRPPLNPGQAPQFKDDLLIQSISDDPIVKLAVVDPAVLADFVIQEADRKMGDTPKALSDWLEARIFCVSEEKNDQIIPDTAAQRRLRDELNAFIRNPSQPQLDLDFNDGLTYHLQRSAGAVQIQNTSPIFQSRKDELFSYLTPGEPDQNGLVHYTLDGSKRQDFIEWESRRKVGKDNKAKELKGHPEFLYLNDPDRRYIGIGASVPTRLDLKADAPLVTAQRTDPFVEVSFSLSNLYSPVPTSLVGSSYTTYSIDLYDIYSRQRIKTIPTLYTATQSNGHFKIPIDQFPQTEYTRFSYSSCIPQTPYAPATPMYDPSGTKQIIAVFPFQADRNASDRYLAMASAGFKVGSNIVPVGAPLTPNFSVDNAKFNPGTDIEVQKSEKISYELYMLERPRLDFATNGLLDDRIPRYALIPLPSQITVSETRNLTDNQAKVYSGPKPSVRSGIFQLQNDVLNRGLISEENPDLAVFNRTLGSYGLSPLTPEQAASLIRFGYLDVANPAGGSGFHLWVERSDAGGSLNTKFTVAVCGDDFYQTLHSHVEKAVISQQSEHDLTSDVASVLQLTSPPKEFDANITRRLTEKTLTSLRYSSWGASATPQAGEEIFIPATTHYLSLSQSSGADGKPSLLIRPGRQAKCLMAFDDGMGSNGYVTVSGEGFDLPADFPDRLITKYQFSCNLDAKDFAVQLASLPGLTDAGKGVMVQAMAALIARDQQNGLSNGSSYALGNGYNAVFRDSHLNVYSSSAHLTNEILLSNVPLAVAVVLRGSEVAVAEGDTPNTLSITHSFVLQAADAEGRLPLQFDLDGVEGGSFTIQKDHAPGLFAVPVVTRGIGNPKRTVGRAYYQYDRTTGACAFDHFEKDDKFTAQLVKEGNYDYLQKTKLDELGQFGVNEADRPKINTTYGRPTLFGDVDWNRKNEISDRLKPYLTTMAAWKVAVKKEVNGQTTTKTTPMQVKVGTPGPGVYQQMILGFPHNGSMLDLFNAIEDENGAIRVVPLNPNGEPFKQFHQDIFDGPSKPTSWLDGFLEQIPTRAPPRSGPFA